MADPARTRRTSRTTAVPAASPREASAVSRRDARVQRAATGPQQTVWSTGASVERVAAVAAAVEVAASVAVSPVVVPAPPVVAESRGVAAPPAFSAAEAAESAPLTRASRRARTAPTQIIDGPVESATPAERVDGAVDPIVPAAALAWAAAAAAAAAQPQIVPVEPVLTPAEPFELLEPVEADEVEPVAEPRVEPTTESSAEPEPAASDVDEFELAARLFAFTGETPIQSAAQPDTQPESETDQSAEASVDETAEARSHVAPTRRGVRNVGRQITAASFSVSVMGIVGLLAVGMTTPAAAVAAVNGTEPTSLLASDVVDSHIDEEDIQAWVAPGDLQSATVERDETYSSGSMGELASQEGITNYSNFFINDQNAAIQWPFAVGVPITYGYGMRSGRMHEGADFVPGQGAEIQAIADGTVRIATSSGGAYGVTVVIDHIIDGQLVSSRYAHMLYGSLKVSPGQHVTVGTVLGNTGNTGRSYGAHTHFEILQGGTTAIDPITWLRSYTGRNSLDNG